MLIKKIKAWNPSMVLSVFFTLFSVHWKLPQEFAFAGQNTLFQNNLAKFSTYMLQNLTQGSVRWKKLFLSLITSKYAVYIYWTILYCIRKKVCLDSYKDLSLLVSHLQCMLPPSQLSASFFLDYEGPYILEEIIAMQKVRVVAFNHLDTPSAADHGCPLHDHRVIPLKHIVLTGDTLTYSCFDSMKHWCTSIVKSQHAASWISGGDSSHVLHTIKITIVTVFIMLISIYSPCQPAYMYIHSDFVDQNIFEISTSIYSQCPPA